MKSPCASSRRKLPPARADFIRADNGGIYRPFAGGRLTTASPSVCAPTALLTHRGSLEADGESMVEDLYVAEMNSICM